MNAWSLRMVLSAALLALVAGAADAQSGKDRTKLYRWVDKNGQVHYGDSVPPEYAEQDRDILNRQGVSVGRDFPPMEKSYARISLGRMEDMEKAMPIFKQVLGKTSV